MGDGTEIAAAAVVGVGLQGTAQGGDVRIVLRLIVISQDDRRVAQNPCEYDGVGSQLVGGAPVCKAPLLDFLIYGRIVFVILAVLDDAGVQNTGFHLPQRRGVGAAHKE